MQYNNIHNEKFELLMKTIIAIENGSSAVFTKIFEPLIASENINNLNLVVACSVFPPYLCWCITSTKSTGFKMYLIVGAHWHPFVKTMLLSAKVQKLHMVPLKDISFSL